LSATARILVVDDDRAVRTALEVNLKRSGYVVSVAERVDEALAMLKGTPFDLVLTDMRMPGGTGLDLLKDAREHWPDMPIVLMTGFGSVADAIAAMKGGAADYLTKPIERDELLVVLERALDHSQLRAEVRQLRQHVQERYSFENLIGGTPAMTRLYDEIDAVADTTATVLLTGPTGTGKELLASAIHFRSRRSGRPFIRINCGAIPETLLESELFGHEKGAFSGAIRQHQGTFERAHTGTLLLDEIGEISPAMQVKLLRVLQEGEVQRVGGSEPIAVDVRVIAATNRDLLEEVRAKRFREDLYYRLNVIRIRVPSLRERRDDIPLLIEHFVKKYAVKEGKPVPAIDHAAVGALLAHDWPGNVRQLEHAVERAMVLHRTGPLVVRPPEEPADSTSPGVASHPPSDLPLPEALLAFERDRIVQALSACGGVQAKAARLLGVSRSNLNYRVQKLGIQVRSIEYE
jgi:DNA-binding NtrC family response regulator